jgi:hypothetical protein
MGNPGFRGKIIQMASLKHYSARNADWDGGPAVGFAMGGISKTCDPMTDRPGMLPICLRFDPTSKVMHLELPPRAATRTMACADRSCAQAAIWR